MAEASPPTNANEKKRKRPRAARACELCRAKKYRCDELMPCSQCKRQKVECVYDVADHVRQRVLGSAPTGPNHNQMPSPIQQAPQSPASKHSPHSSGFNSMSHNASHLSTHTQQARTGVTNITRQISRSSGDPPMSSDLAEEASDVEVIDVNPHTQNAEFHGKTSSIAFLAALQTQAPGMTGASPSMPARTAENPSLVSAFHNEAFSPESVVQSRHDKALLEAERYHFRQAQVFLDGYFQNIHFIHPILDKSRFRDRCEDLWFGRASKQPRSFVALYYSVMSLGALIKTWDEEKFDGLGRLDWSRKLFNLARIALDSVRSIMTVEAVQCLFFMAKVSQNELNPSLAYTYLGQATRASFSAGFNRRRTSNADPLDASDESISKLWWGLYSLETEISFSLGRPDSLGLDAYHNQVMPALDETETGFISVMVQFARIIKEVTMAIYLSDATLDAKALSAESIEMKMNDWLQGTPSIIKPAIFETTKIRKISKDPIWAKRQRLVLELRFHNVKMVLFRPFLAAVVTSKRDSSSHVQQAVTKCVEAAKSTINIMHEMYCHHIFFRSWFYNTTYVLYAASIVLCYALKVGTQEEREEFLVLAGKAVEILDAMEESIVAKNASRIVQQIISSAKALAGAEASSSGEDRQTSGSHPEHKDAPPDDNFLINDSFLSLFDLDENHDFLSMTFPLDSSHLPFWNDANESLSER